MIRRLIDANRLIKKAYRSGMWNRSTQAFDLFVVDAEDVEDAPTIDAEPVRHGRWELIEEQQWNCEFMILVAYKCSECGKEIVPNKENYCPNCGAKMDVEVQDG